MTSADTSAAPTTGDYRSMEVESINRVGNSVEMELYDSESGETGVFEFDGD